MKICLPLIHLDNLVFTPLPQLLLKQSLVQAGHDPSDISIMEFSREGDIQASFDSILSFKPDMVGFSCYVWSFMAIERMSRALKESGVRVVWGGPHVSESPEWFLEKYPDSVDIVVPWYGERAIVEAVRSSPAPGILRVETPPLQEIPMPYNPAWFPSTMSDHISERVFLMETYRNCPFQCSYCLWGQAANKIDAITAERFILDFEHCLSIGARHFKFADAGLGVVRHRDKQVWRYLADSNLHNMGVNLRTYFFWQVIDEEWCDIFGKLISQGVIGQLDVGIQTFNPKALVDMQRPTDYKKFDKMIGLLKKHSIPYSIDLILGLPGDNLEGFRYSVKQCINHKPDRFQSFLCSILPGTMYDIRRKELGIKTIRGSLMDDDEKVVENATFSRDDMRIALDLEAWLFMVYSLKLFKIGGLAMDAGVGEIDIVEALSKFGLPHTTQAMLAYRRNLYDSRQKGRVECDTYLLGNFREIADELVLFFKSQGASGPTLASLLEDLMKFPKPVKVGETLVGLEGIEWCWPKALMRPGSPIFSHHLDPIPGVIGTKYAFWVWK